MTFSGLGKDSADDQNTVDIFWLNRYGYLDGYKRGGIKWTHGFSGQESSIGLEGNTLDDPPYVRFFYTITRSFSGEKVKKDYKVYLTTTPCNFGGQRYWFICPLTKNGVPCDRRVGTLYGAGDYYGCRHCYDLTYDSRKWSFGPAGAAGKVLLGYKKAEELEKKIKRRYYAGRPTRRQRQLDRLQSRMVPDIADFYRQNDDFLRGGGL